MDSYKETFETWNKVALLYQNKFMDLDLYNDTYDAFCKLLTGNEPAILEIGCGPGNITKYLLKKRPDFKITGIDIAPNMIELAKANNPAAHFMVFDCRDIEKLDSMYDGIICGFCLPYLTEEDGFKLVDNCKNKLNGNGVLYLSFVEGEPSQSGYLTASTGDRTYFHYYALDKLSELLISNGFEKPQVHKVNYKRTEDSQETHTIVIAKKNAGQ